MRQVSSDVGRLLRLVADRHHPDVERRDRLRPHDAAVIGELLDGDARMRAGPMPYEPIQTGCPFPASSRNMAPIGSEYRVPSLKMLPTSIIGSMRQRAAAVDARVAGLGVPDVGDPRRDSPGRARRSAGDSRSGSPRRRSRPRRSWGRSGSRATAPSAMPTAPIEPGSAPNAARISSGWAGRCGVPSTLPSFSSCRRWSPRTTASTTPPCSSSGTTITDFAVRPSSMPRNSASAGDGADARRVHLLERRAQRRRHRPRHRHRHLDVGRVVAAVAEHDPVLARRRRRHVLVGAEAAHHADVGVDLVEPDPRPLEDAVVGDLVARVALVEPGAIAVERVRVLHDELARAQHAGLRARLVPLLDLDVVPDLRQVTVRADRLGRVQRDTSSCVRASTRSRPTRSLSLNSSGMP